MFYIAPIFVVMSNDLLHCFLMIMNSVQVHKCVVVYRHTGGVGNWRSAWTNRRNCTTVCCYRGSETVSRACELFSSVLTLDFCINFSVILQ